MYLGHFVSGVPFDGQKQLRKRLWDVYTVMSAERQVDRRTGRDKETDNKTGTKIETGKDR